MELFARGQGGDLADIARISIFAEALEDLVASQLEDRWTHRKLKM